MSSPEPTEEEVALFLQEGPDTPVKVRALMHRLWEVTHRQVPAEEMLVDLAFLTGVSVALLGNYAKALDERDALAHAVWMVGNMDTAEDKTQWWLDYAQLYELASVRVTEMHERGVEVTKGFEATGLKADLSR